MAALIGIAPDVFWRLTPVELQAITDAHRDHARQLKSATPGHGLQRIGPEDLARRRRFIDDMKRRFPDGPANSNQEFSMADLTIEDFLEGGLNATYVAAAGGGDAAENLDGNVIIHVKNADASAKTITVTAQKPAPTVQGFGVVAKADVAVAIPAGEDRFIGPFPKQAFNDAANKVQITYSAVTSVTIAALRLRKAVG